MRTWSFLLGPCVFFLIDPWPLGPLCALFDLCAWLFVSISLLSVVGVGVGGGVKVRVKTRLKGRQSSSTPLFVHCCSFLPLLTLAHSPLTCSSHLFTAISQHSLRWHSKEDSARACSVENPTSLKGYFFPKPTEASLRGFLMSVENVRVVPGSN